jgi:hypothetical protein
MRIMVFEVEKGGINYFPSLSTHSRSDNERDFASLNPKSFNLSVNVHLPALPPLQLGEEDRGGVVASMFLSPSITILYLTVFNFPIHN